MGKVGREVVKRFDSIISDNQGETCDWIDYHDQSCDTSIGDLPLIITISDTWKNQAKRIGRIDSENTINLSRLISEPCIKVDTQEFPDSWDPFRGGPRRQSVLVVLRRWSV